MAAEKMMVVTIGYDTYALEDGDAIALLAIARRAVRVQQPGFYSDPHVLVPDRRLFVSHVTLLDVDLRPTPGDAPGVVPTAPPPPPLTTPVDPDDRPF